MRGNVLLVLSPVAATCTGQIVLVLDMFQQRRSRGRLKLALIARKITVHNVNMTTHHDEHLALQTAPGTDVFAVHLNDESRTELAALNLAEKVPVYGSWPYLCGTVVRACRLLLIER